MKIDILHGFPHRSHDLVGLFEGVNKLSTFMSRLDLKSGKL